VEGVADKVRIVEGDIFKEDFGGASVVTLYLLPHLNLCVRHRILALEPATTTGSRVGVTHSPTTGVSIWPILVRRSFRGRRSRLCA
jgi:hypothetical protein